MASSSHQSLGAVGKIAKLDDVILDGLSKNSDKNKENLVEEIESASESQAIVYEALQRIYGILKTTMQTATSPQVNGPTEHGH